MSFGSTTSATGAQPPQPRHLTPAEHYAQAELNLFHASAARFGSPEEDSYLRVALIHATLAGVPRTEEDRG